MGWLLCARANDPRWAVTTETTSGGYAIVAGVTTLNAPPNIIYTPCVPASAVTSAPTVSLPSLGWQYQCRGERLAGYSWRLGERSTALAPSLSDEAARLDDDCRRAPPGASQSGGRRGDGGASHWSRRGKAFELTHSSPGGQRMTLTGSPRFVALQAPRCLPLIRLSSCGTAWSSLGRLKCPRRAVVLRIKGSHRMSSG